jgi:hypothetical protein
MKYLALSFMFLIIAVFLVTCKTQEEMATKTAKEFLECIKTNKFDKAKKIATPESASYIDFMAMLQQSVPSGDKKKIENLKCGIVEDTAHCTYFEDGEEKTIDLVRQNSKWLVDMKKESPPATNTDNTNTTENNYSEDDTTTYYDVVLSEIKEVNGAAQIVFEFTNRSDWNIAHLWLDIYFTDANGKFMQKKQIYVDGLLKNSMALNITNSDEIKEKNKIIITLENTRADNIGEIFILPLRIRMENAYYEKEPNAPYLDNIFSFANYYTLIKNKTDYNVKITFE